MIAIKKVIVILRPFLLLPLMEAVRPAGMVLTFLLMLTNTHGNSQAIIKVNKKGQIHVRIWHSNVFITHDCLVLLVEIRKWSVNVNDLFVIKQSYRGFAPSSASTPKFALPNKPTKTLVKS